MCVLGFIGITSAVSAPMKRIVGTVVDGVTGEPLPYVTVKTDRKNRNVVTDSLGVFVIHVPSKSSINISSQGYGTEKIKGPFGTDTLRVQLFPSTVDLQEVIIRPKKKKYSKKNNPAVDLMERVRANYKELNPEKTEGYNYDTYDKLVIGLSGGEDAKGMWVMPVGDRKKFKNLIDTAVWSGEPIIDLAVKETSAVHVRKDGRNIDVVTGSRADGMDKSYSKDFTTAFLKDAMREVDIYDNDISMVRNAFVSPLSRAGADFYMYHIEDTVQIGKNRCVELSFAPHNPSMTGFNGKLYIPVDDSVRYVRRVMMRLPKASNVNYIEGMVISQNYVRDSVGKIHKTLDDLIMHVKIMPGTPVFYFSRQTRRDNFGYDGRPDMDPYIMSVGNQFTVENADTRDDEFWTENRMVPLTNAEKHIFSKESVFRTDVTFKVLNTILNILIRSYIPTGKEATNKVLLGPVMSLLSHSNGEGWRMQLGCITTGNLMPHVFLRGYLAYGFGDHRWKGGAEVEYSFASKKNARDFPLNNILAGYSYDINTIGRLGADASATLLSSWQRATDDFYTYQHKASIQYTKEWMNHLSITAGFRFTRQIPGQNKVFTDGYGNSFRELNQAVFRATIRWAPGEKFAQSIDRRSRINRDALVLSLSQEYGPKGFLGSRYTLSRTDLSVDKTFHLSAYGHIDISIAGCKIWTQVPFTELCWQRANTSYISDGRSFMLMNPMEFATDEYVSWSMQYHMRGILLDRIPLIKKAKLREFVSFRGFFGHLTPRNNPATSSKTPRFPTTINTTTMNGTPYMECSVGIENILTILRVEYVWRLTYRNRPDIARSGLRIGFHFTF